jgi:glutamyl/glutaminyl-tRNA synthetase
MKAKIWKRESALLVLQAVEEMQSLPPSPSVQQLTQCLDAVVSKANVKNPALFSPLRYLLTGVTAGIGVPVIMSLIGMERTLSRLRNVPKA